MSIFFDFSAWLLFATLLCLIIIIIDKYAFKKARLQHAKEDNQKAKDPVLVDYAKSFFPILLIVFCLRSFVIEPFRIPSGSMKPTLLEGDFVLVNKYNYGIRLPITGTKVLDLGQPKRGDVMVFRYPVDPTVNFIKRIVGLPGDKISYKDKTLYINGEKAKVQFIENDIDHSIDGGDFPVKQYTEAFEDFEHSIWINSKAAFNMKEITVPEGHYFAMGDNRDNSEDGRVWGFVPDVLVIGRASHVWMSWDGINKDIRWNRIGSSIN